MSQCVLCHLHLMTWHRTPSTEPPFHSQAWTSSLHTHRALHSPTPPRAVNPPLFKHVLPPPEAPHSLSFPLVLSLLPPPLFPSSSFPYRFLIKWGHYLSPPLQLGCMCFLGQCIHPHDFNNTSMFTPPKVPPPVSVQAWPLVLCSQLLGGHF